MSNQQNDYEYYDGTDDDGDFLLIRKEDLENLNVKGVSGNSDFDDVDQMQLPAIPKGKYYVVRIMETREY